MSVNLEILEHIQQNILPKYEHFDNAHNPQHAERVIQNSLSIAKDYDVDINKVYVIAAYHDVGLAQGRKDHEKNSAAFLLSDSALAKWFSKDELILMAEAIEDHRASNDHAPRSIYGRIVSEADRDIEYVTILTRVIQYSIEHYPSYTQEEHFVRSYNHLQDKYGEGGYLKLWLDTERNRRNLQELREAMASVDRFKADFMRIFQLVYPPPIDYSSHKPIIINTKSKCEGGIK